MDTLTKHFETFFDKPTTIFKTDIFKHTEEGKYQIVMENLKKSLVQPKRGAEEAWEDYKQRMRETNRALKLILRGRLVYNSSNMVPFKVQ